MQLGYKNRIILSTIVAKDCFKVLLFLRARFTATDCPCLAEVGRRNAQILFEALLTSITVRLSTAPPGSSVVVRSESVGRTSPQSDASNSPSEPVSAESDWSEISAQ